MWNRLWQRQRKLLSWYWWVLYCWMWWLWWGFGIIVYQYSRFGTTRIFILDCSDITFVRLGWAIRFVFRDRYAEPSALERFLLFQISRDNFRKLSVQHLPRRLFWEKGYINTWDICYRYAPYLELVMTNTIFHSASVNLLSVILLSAWQDLSIYFYYDENRWFKLIKQYALQSQRTKPKPTIQLISLKWRPKFKNFRSPKLMRSRWIWNVPMLKSSPIQNQLLPQHSMHMERNILFISRRNKIQRVLLQSILIQLKKSKMRSKWIDSFVHVSKECVPCSLQKQIWRWPFSETLAII